DSWVTSIAPSSHTDDEPSNPNKRFFHASVQSVVGGAPASVSPHTRDDGRCHHREESAKGECGRHGKRRARRAHRRSPRHSKRSYPAIVTSRDDVQRESPAAPGVEGVSWVGGRDRLGACFGGGVPDAAAQ